jgi:hypothetical protein
MVRSLQISKTQQMLFAAVAHLAEGLMSLICLVGTRRETVFIVHKQLILYLNGLTTNKASGCRRPE